MMMFHSQKVGILLFLSCAALIAGAIILLQGARTTEEVACTLEAKICPDGSAVGRVAPSCEFAPCPVPENNPLLLETQDVRSGVYFMYLKALPTFYSEAQDWPPQLAVTDGPFACTEAGDVHARAGKTSLQKLGGKEYCVTEMTEGAAGSVYTQYAYAFPYNDDVAIFTFSMRSVQCGNYDEVQGQACEEDQANLDLLSIVDQMAVSLHTGH